MHRQRSSREQRNLEIVQATVRWQNEKNFDAFLGVLSDEFIWKSDALLPVPGFVQGKIQVRQALDCLYAVFPDIQLKEEFISASGNTVTMVTRNFGTKTNGFMGLPPINRPWQFNANGIYTFNDQGLMIENWFFWDRGWVLGQLGAIPDVSFIGR